MEGVRARYNDSDIDDLQFNNWWLKTLSDIGVFHETVKGFEKQQCTLLDADFDMNDWYLSRDEEIDNLNNFIENEIKNTLNH